MKWRATFSIDFFDEVMGWIKNYRQITRIIEIDDYDKAMIYGNAMIGEETGWSEKLGRLMFIKLAKDNADLSENCPDLQYHFTRTSSKLQEMQMPVELIADMQGKINRITTTGFIVSGEKDR